MYLPLLFNQPPPLPDKEGVLMYGSKFTQKPRFENRELSRHPTSTPRIKKGQINQIQNQVCILYSTPQELVHVFINILASEEMLHVVHK